MKQLVKYKLPLLVFVFIAFLFSACSSDSSDLDKNAKAFIEVVDANGERVPNQTVQVFNEKDYERFSKDNTLLPTDYCHTGANGKVIYEIETSRWFKTGESTQITFVVQFGAGESNYSIWSVGKTFRPGKDQQILIKLARP